MCKASNYFIESLDLKEHPMIQAKEKVKIEYFMALSYVVHHLVEQVENQIQQSRQPAKKQVGQHFIVLTDHPPQPFQHTILPFACFSPYRRPLRDF